MKLVQVIQVNLTMPLTTPFAIFLCGLFISLNVLAKDLEGKIVGISDDDTVTMLIEAPNGKLNVRFYWDGTAQAESHAKQNNLDLWSLLETQTVSSR